MLLSLCLSRACLGKMVVLTVKWQRKKTRFLTSIATFWLRSTVCARNGHPRGLCGAFPYLCPEPVLVKHRTLCPRQVRKRGDQKSGGKGATISHLIISPRFSRRALTTACKETHHSFFGVLLSLCLSRACLGKIMMVHFRIKWRVFSCLPW